MTGQKAVAGATVPLLTRRFLGDYARNPVNVLILVLVPAGFVAGAAGSLAQISRLLSGTMAPGAAVQAVTAGWAAAFIAAIAAYFQIRAARAADRRLVLAGLPARRLAAARAITGLALALLASAAALLKLGHRACFVAGQHVGDDLVDADHGSDAPGCGLAVAGKHDRAHAKSGQRGNGVLRGLPGEGVPPLP